ncbi:MAG: preprotein translocase subunit YajC [Nitrospirota bacterium]|nr:preprotein translocase subunit YajC [Nitrospirota bacterium]
MTDWTELIGPATAYAQGGTAPTGGGAFLTSFAPFIVIFVLFWVLLIRPQQKRQKEHRSLVDNLKKGDKVITNGGMFGTVMAVSSETITLQVADNVKIKMLRSEIMGMQAEIDA